MATTAVLARATSMPIPLSTPVRPASCPAAAHLGGASLLLQLGHTRTRADGHGSAAATTIPRVATSGSLVGGSARRRPSAAPSTRGARARSNSGCRAAEGRHVMRDGGAIDERFGVGDRLVHRRQRRPPRHPRPRRATPNCAGSTPPGRPRRWLRTRSRWPRRSPAPARPRASPAAGGRPRAPRPPRRPRRPAAPRPRRAPPPRTRGRSTPPAAGARL